MRVRDSPPSRWCTRRAVTPTRPLRGWTTGWLHATPAWRPCMSSRTSCPSSATTRASPRCANGWACRHPTKCSVSAQAIRHMTEFFARLKQRKLVQWAIAYVAFAFALIQVLDVVADSYDWPHSAMHVVFGLLALGFVIALVLAWYHGEKGRQRVSGAELLLIALVLAIGGGLLWRFGRSASPSATSRVAKATSP